jgi:poly-beta-1,6-N-acetyl-D-glucosamine biosynthesis protein PgaD
MPEIEITDRPKLRSFFRNITEMSFTSVAWGFWVYLFLPLVNIVLWLLGARIFYLEVIDTAGYKEFLDLWGRLGWSILGVFLVLRIWGYYNYWRFGRRDRRKGISFNTHEKLAEYFQVPLEQIPDLQSNKEIVWPIQHDPKQDIADWMVSKGLSD